MAKQDIERNSNRWENFKKINLSLNGFSKINIKLTKDFLNDFELGINVPSSSKGKRTPGTLLKLRGICVFLNKHLKKDFNKLTKKQLHKLFNDMSDGKILKENKTPYKDTGDYVKNIKTFWKWMIKTKKAKEDITEDLSRASYKKSKPAWVYLSHEQMKKLIDNARGDYRALLLFLYDSGIRPQEAYRIKVSDITFGDEVLLNIPETRETGERVSKTFERTIKLKNSGNHIKKYIEDQKLKADDYLVVPNQFTFNKYIRTLSKRLFGEELTKARGYTHKLRLYDIRHISAIFWLDKYRRNQDLMYRFGWSREDKIYYYSEFLGRRDKIDDEDMITSEDKTKYEKQIDKQNIKIKEQDKRFKDFELKMLDVIENNFKERMKDYLEFGKPGYNEKMTKEYKKRFPNAK